MIVVRPGRPGDCAAIARVHVETWRIAYAGVLPDSVLVRMSLDRHRSMWSRLLGRPDPDQSVLVAESDGRVIGFGSCGPARGARLSFQGEVYTLYVDTDHQGSGVGRRLLASLFQALIDKGLNSALLWVLAANPSQFFYQAMGGRRVAEREEFLWSITVPEIGYGWPDLTDALRAGGPCSVF